LVPILSVWYLNELLDVECVIATDGHKSRPYKKGKEDHAHASDQTLVKQAVRVVALEEPH
jgi:hypothetical protein